MIEHDFELIGNNYTDTSNVPKDDDIWYRCTDCGKMIPSVPEDNIGCECGNVFIDKDCWRLVVANMKTLEVIRKTVNAKKVEG